MECFNILGEYTFTTLISITVVALVSLIVTLTAKRNFPPGPRGIPVLGYIPFLGPKPYKTLKTLSRKYGEIFSLPMGMQNTIVLNTFGAVKEALKMESFLGRPPNIVTSSDKYTNIANMDGQNWVDHTKFTKIAMREIGMGTSQGTEIIQEEIGKILSTLETMNLKSDINIRDLSATCFDNISLSMLCSKSVGKKEEISKVLQHFQLLLPRYFSMKSLCSSLPFWLKPLSLTFSSKLKGLKETVQKVEHFFRNEIQNHIKNLDPANSNDFIDYYLNEINEKKPNFDESTLNGMLQLFLLASSETSRVSLEWSLLYLAKYPELQEKVYLEVIGYLGTEKKASWSDQENLPYTRAFLCEIQRRKTIAPLALNRRTTENCILDGFNIPKDTVVIVNLWGIHMDETCFTEPKVFKPERFLTKDKKKISIPESFIPFSYGPRKCPGEKMAEISMFLSFVSFIQKYRICPSKNGVSLKSEFRTVTLPLHPFVRLEAR